MCVGHSPNTAYQGSLRRANAVVDRSSITKALQAHSASRTYGSPRKSIARNLRDRLFSRKNFGFLPQFFTALAMRAATRVTRAGGPQKSGRWSRTALLRVAAVLVAVVGFSGAAIAAGGNVFGGGFTGTVEPAPLTLLCTKTSEWIWTQLQRLDHLVHPGPARDVLGLLIGTTLIVPWMKNIRTSPIMGFLAMGVLLGPSGFGVIHNLEITHFVGEFGLIFFLFEMGLRLPLQKVWSMRFDVFGLGVVQYVGSAAVIGLVAHYIYPSLNLTALIVLGSAVALSSSAFVLQLLQDNGQLGTRYGKASLGVLLFQEMAVVPFLVIVPLVAGSGSGGVSLQYALSQAMLRAMLSLSIIWIFGRNVLNNVYRYVTDHFSSEAFLAVTLGTVMLCSCITEGLGLSNTLGAFFGGVLLADTTYVHQVEADIAPFRGMLLGLFFTTVGFSIDVLLLFSHFFYIVPFVIGSIAIKVGIMMIACLPSGMSSTSSLQTSLLLATGGEFAFVLFGMADGMNVFPPIIYQVLVTSTALSMGLTPILANTGDKIAAKWRAGRGRSAFKGQDDETMKLLDSLCQSDEGFVVICGYGRIGKVICELLDGRNTNYIVLDNHPVKSIRARSHGLPVFLADATKAEVLESFRVGEARMAIIAVSNVEITNQVTQVLRETYPNLDVVVRAKDDAHQKYMTDILGVRATVPSLPHDSVLLALPFGGTVLKRLGINETEVDTIVEEERRKVFEQRLDQDFIQATEVELEEAFKVYDADGSGKISKDEVQQIMKTMGRRVSLEEVTLMLKEVGVEDEEVDFKAFVLMVS